MQVEAPAGPAWADLGAIRERCMTARLRILAALAVALPLHDARGIQQLKSLYTVIDLKACTALTPHAGETAWLCDGLEGYPVYIAEDAQRTYLSVGPSAAQMRAAKQSLAAPNSLFDGKSPRTTVEWRFVIRDERPVPYATIVRYFTASGPLRGEVLVVTRVAASEVCHVAYIDAMANADAIVQARRIADKKARAFSCASDPGVEGLTGKSPM
jgi:hypothetical protein